MDSEYYEVTEQLDAREILRYLNDLGIHNISGEALKYFITDLKKLIKYDLQQRNKCSTKTEPIGPERLHSASTFSSRVRSKVNDGCPLTCTREYDKERKPLSVRNIHSAPNLVRPQCEKPLRRACSCVRVEKNIESKHLTKDRVTTTTSNNLIKVPIQPAKKKCDPVSLYHYYTSLWAKYKPNVPGENNWADLRWSVRQKMVGQITQPTVNKLSTDRESQQSKKRS